jgi:hypothetical protein
VCVVMHEFDFALACVFVVHKFEISFCLILTTGPDWASCYVEKGSLHSTHPKINK